MAKKLVLLMRKAWTEGKHPRDGAGRFAMTPEAGSGVSGERKNIENGLDALERLARGEDFVKDAMRRPELEQMGGTSGITFYWGESGRSKQAGQYRGGYGFKKIIEKHGIMDAIKVVDTIANGKIGKPYGVENGKRVDIVNKDHQTTISLYKDGKSESWVLTGYTVDENADAKGRGSDLASATQTGPIRTRADLGAALSSSPVSPECLKKSITCINFRIARWNLERAIRRKKA